MKRIIARAVPEGTVPLINIEGPAYDCGRTYGEIVLSRYPGYTRYLNQVPAWGKKNHFITGLFEKHAPQVLDIFRGLQAALTQANPPKIPAQSPEACTAFSVAPAITLDKTPLSGQTKDTVIESALKYIVLRMRVKNAPTILVLAYPGEILGYGMWSNGMTIFRNSLNAKGNSNGKLNMTEWGLLALGGGSICRARELAEKFGIQGSGNCLISDRQGASLSVEFNAGGASFIRPKKGINVHTNHPAGKKTAPFEDYPDAIERKDSRYRLTALWKLLDAERGKLTAQKTLMDLADHSHYPRGICRHPLHEKDNMLTSAAIVAEPAKGKLHVTRGNPCANWPATYTF